MHPPTTDWPEGPPIHVEPVPTTDPQLSARRRRPAAMQRWSRLVHVYTSMAALLVVLFFGATGITLNHPEWTFGIDPTVTTATGTIPAGAIEDDGGIELLTFSEYLRSAEDVGGEVSDFGSTDSDGYISYRAPGYAADVTIDLTDGTYDLIIEERGVIGVLNDLHKGRSTNGTWGWVIDAAGGLLVVAALAGLALQLALRKRRISSLVVAAFGGAAVAAVALTTLA